MIIVDFYDSQTHYSVIEKLEAIDGKVEE